MTERLLRVRDLHVRYPGRHRPALAGLDLDVAAGECVAVVGPSGCGKSTLCRALLDLLPPGSERRGAVIWQGVDLVRQPARWPGVRGRGLALVAQDHRHALDPVRRVVDQVTEVLAVQRPSLDRAARSAAAVRLLADVRLPDPDRLGRRYPHQLSGGQRQRASLAAALAAGPRLLLADEPTTALDLLVQREVIALLAGLVRDRGLSLLLVSHDRDLVDRIAHRVVELAPPVAAAPVAAAPSGVTPSGGTPSAEAPRGGVPDSAPEAAGRMVRSTRAEAPTCLLARGVTVHLGGDRGMQPVVQDVDLVVREGRTLGLVGESGAGKTTLARALAGWIPLAAGRVELPGPDAGVGPDAGAGAGAGSGWPRAVQLASQDAAAALDPRQTALAAVTEAARAAGHSAAAAVREARSLLAAVALPASVHGSRPAGLSGGQRQRLQLARAVAAAPRVLIADEPASSLDPGTRNRILGLLRRLQEKHRLGVVLIAHDLRVVERWADEVAVLLGGRLVELYRPGDVGSPRHPFTRALAAAAPGAGPGFADPRALPPAGSSPDQRPPADGCPYAPRCPLVQPACRRRLPALQDLGAGRLLRCPETDRQAR